MRYQLQPFISFAMPDFTFCGRIFDSASHCFVQLQQQQQPGAGETNTAMAAFAVEFLCRSI